MTEPFDLQFWLERHELDQPQQLEQALHEVPAEQRTLALLTWLNIGELHGHKIRLPLQ